MGCTTWNERAEGKKIEKQNCQSGVREHRLNTVTLFGQLGGGYTWVTKTHATNLFHLARVRFFSIKRPFIANMIVRTFCQWFPLKVRGYSLKAAENLELWNTTPEGLSLGKPTPLMRWYLSSTTRLQCFRTHGFDVVNVEVLTWGFLNRV